MNKGIAKKLYILTNISQDVDGHVYAGTPTFFDTQEEAEESARQNLANDFDISFEDIEYEAYEGGTPYVLSMSRDGRFEAYSVAEVPVARLEGTAGTTKDADSADECLLGVVETSAGALRAYKSPTPGQPGIFLMLQPKGYEDEIDLAFASVCEDPEYRTADNEGPEDVVLFSYGDVHTEDYTGKDILRRDSIRETLNSSLMDSISLDGVRYAVRRIDVPGYGEGLQISTETLNNELFNENGEYVSAEARDVDEQIFFYVPEAVVITATDQELVEFVLSNL